MPFRRLGRYELLEELGRDDDAIVYKARDRLLGRLVAIHTVERDPDAQSRSPQLERKAGLAGRLGHPNIVTVHDAGVSRGTAYITTELVEGETLRDVLDSGVVLPPAAIERIAAQVADGLDFMHRHGVVHGDVDPTAVMVLDIGFVKISYLGNALFPVGASMPLDAFGTSPYRSPEHVTGAPLDARSDVFCLGVVLYEMLTGVAPFTGRTPQELVDEITSKHPQPPSAVNPGIPSGFDYIVARALSKDPDHRYPSARDMAVQLRRWALEPPTFFDVPRPAAPVPAVAVSSEPVERVETLRTRRQWLAYGVPAVLLTMGAAWTLWSASSARIRTAPASDMPGARAASDAELVPVREQSPPSVADAEAKPAGPADTAPAGAYVETQPLARLKLAVSPWGEIYVDGRKRGVSPPLRHIELTPGKHRIEIRNTIFPTRHESIEVDGNARLRIKHKFR